MKHTLALYLFLAAQSLTSFSIAHSACSAKPVKLAAAEFAVEVLKYQSQNPEQKSIILMPPTGGTNSIDRSYAKNLCQSGFDVYIIEHWTGEAEFSLDLLIHERHYSRAQKAIGITIENIKSKFIGILGTSVGAIYTSVAMSLHDKLNAAFVIVGGADVPEIIATSDQDILVKVRDERFKLSGYKNNEEYIRAISEVFPYKVSQLPSLYKGKKLGMVIADADTTVPTATQNYLRDLWQPQVVYNYSGNHLTVILKTWRHRDDIVEFFSKAAEGL